MKKILTIIATVAAVAGAAEKLTVRACPISTHVGAPSCVTHKVDVMPQFNHNIVVVHLDDGKMVIYNLGGWSISISN